MGEFCELRSSKSTKYAFLYLCLVCFLLIAPSLAKADSGQYFYDPGSRASGVLDSVNGTAQYTFDRSGNITAITKNALTALTVLQASPSAAAIGGTVTILGTGFGTVSNTSVSFNGTSATPSAVTTTSITVTVPTGAVTGTLSVTAPAGTVGMAAPFTVLSTAAPTITSFTTGTSTPTIASMGSTVTITGTNFDTAYSKVLVNDQYAQLISATSTTLVITVPASSSGKISVQTPTGTAISSSDLIIAPPTYTTTVVNSIRTTVGASPVTATNGGSGTVSLVLFDATAGQRITAGVNLSGVAGCPTIGTLMPNGTSLVPGVSTCSSYFYSGPFSVPQSGTYSVEFIPNSISGTYQAQLFNVPPDVTQAATFGGTTNSISLTAPGQQGSFTFSGTASQKVSMYFNASGLGGLESYYTLYNPDGTVLEPSTLVYGGTWGNSPIILPQTGTYTFKVAPYLNGAGAGIGTATLQLYNVPADITQAVTLGSASNISITAPGQQGNYTFSGTSAQNISYYIDPTSINSQEVYYTLYNPDGTVLVSSTLTNGTTYGNSPVILPQTGTYKLNITPRLNNATDGTGTVSATIYNVPAPATASVTVGGAEVKVSLTAPGQLAVFSFSGTSGNAYTTTMDFSGLSSSCNTFSILNPDGTTFNGPNFTCSSSASTGSLTVSQTGTFKISVTPSLSSGPNPSGTGMVGATVTHP